MRRTFRARWFDPRVLAAAILAGLCVFDLALLAGPVPVGVIAGVAIVVVIALWDRLHLRTASSVARLEAELAAVRDELATAPATAAPLTGIGQLGAGLVRVRHELATNRDRIEATDGRWPALADGLFDAQWRALQDALSSFAVAEAASYAAVAGAYTWSARLRRVNALHALVPGGPVDPDELAAAVAAHDLAQAQVDQLLKGIVALG